MEVKFLKIKPWMIKFKINDDIFFIKFVDEIDENKTALYKYIPTDDKGHYRPKWLKSCYGISSLSDYFSEPFSCNKGGIYRDIKDHSETFLSRMAINGFGEYIGLNEFECKKYILKNKIQKIEYRIAKLEKETDSIRSDIEEIERELECLHNWQNEQ